MSSNILPLDEGIKLSNIYLLPKTVTGGNLIPMLNDSFTVSFGTARRKIMEKCGMGKNIRIPYRAA